MVVDPITANPVAGESFTITGSISSDNGSALEIRNGDPLTANVLFTIDNDASGFTLSDGVVQADGNWSATIALSSGFAAEHTSLRPNIYHLSTIIQALVLTNLSTVVVTQSLHSSDRRLME